MMVGAARSSSERRRWGAAPLYALRYNYGSNPLRVSWRLMRGDLMTRLDGEYEFAAIPDDPNSTQVTYYLSVDLVVPLPGFVKRRAEARIMHTAPRRAQDRRRGACRCVTRPSRKAASFGVTRAG